MIQLCSSVFGMRVSDEQDECNPCVMVSVVLNELDGTL